MSSVATVVAVVAGVRAGICMIALPTLIRSVVAAIHAIGVTASGPVGLGRPDGVEAEPVGLLRERDAAERVVVPELQSRGACGDPTRVSDALFPPAYLERRARYRAFMEEHVYPNERAARPRGRRGAGARREPAGEGAQRAGLWAPHMPPEAGGTGDGFLYYACMNEEIGRSLLGAARLRLPGPRRGQRRDPAHVRHARAEGALPASRSSPGEVRSFFSMTEPDVAGSDPTTLRTRAVLDGDEWVIDGHKWFSSGADGCGVRDRHRGHRPGRRDRTGAAR